MLVVSFPDAKKILESLPKRNPRDLKTEGWLYVAVHAAFPGFFKIGMTRTNVENRLGQYITGLPYGRMLAVFALYTEGIRSFEQEVHAQFHRYRKQGEWFQLPHNVLDAFVQRYKHETKSEMLSWETAPVGTAYYNRRFLDDLELDTVPVSSWSELEMEGRRKRKLET